MFKGSQLKVESLRLGVGEHGKFISITAFYGNPYVEKGENSEILGVAVVGTDQDPVRLKDKEMPFPAEVIEQSNEVESSNGGFTTAQPQLCEPLLSRFREKLPSDFGGSVEVALLFGEKQNGVPYPAKLADKPTPYAVAGSDAAIPSIRPESIVFAQFSPGHHLFNSSMPRNGVVGHRHSPWEK